MKKLLKRIVPEFLRRGPIFSVLHARKQIFSVAKELSKETGISYWTLLFDISLSALCFVTPYEYKMYRFYEKSHWTRDRFMTRHRMEKMVREFNRGDVSLMRNKQQFNRYFSDFIGRQWLYAPDASDQQIENFLDTQKQIIVKPTDCAGGSGIQKLLRSDISDVEVFSEYARKGCSLLEEVVEQHPDLSSINPSSVNTIRINTVIDRAGVPHILCAGLRMGRGQVVTDNLSVSGLFAQADLDTGILFTLAIGADLQTHVKHPTSGVILPGFQIPHWEAAKEMVLRAAKMVPQIRWVAWDVAITKKGPLLIEGNASLPAPRIMQFATQTGYYYILRAYL